MLQTQRLKKIWHEAKYYPAALLVSFFYIMFYILPIDIASALAGFITEKIGVFLKASKTAKLNLQRTMPHLTPQQIDIIVANMWNNLGRIIGEFPHWATISSEEYRKRVEISWGDFAPGIKPTIVISAHIGNWELYNRINREHDIKLHMVQRKINNPLINNFIARLRIACGASGLINKGVDGVRQILKTLHSNENVGLLVDQRLTDGVPTIFFGIPTTISNLPEKLKQKANYPICMTRTIRKRGAYYKVEFHYLNCSNDMITESITKQYEAWIRQYPAQWLWAHDRWNFIKNNVHKS